MVRYVVLGLVALLLLGGVAGFVAYRTLDDNIAADERGFGDVLGDRPVMPRFADGRPVNILVLGTDSREGQTYVRGSTPGLADTTLLVHLSRDRSRAFVISIPRDLMVDRPACRAKDGSGILPATGPVIWNAAYARGGTACVVAQFEQMTRIRVDHFVQLRFESVTKMADALGGVPVCVDELIDDPRNSIYLPAGCYDATGNVALSYVRVRYKIGDESDVSRLERQQEFMGSMLRKALSVGTLSNPVTTYRFLDEVTSSFVTDPELASLSALAGLANQVRQIGTDRVEMFSMPFTAYRPDPNRLAPAPEAAELWRQLRLDEPVDPAFLSR